MARRRANTNAKVTVNSGKYNVIPAGSYYGVLRDIKLESYPVESGAATQEKLTPNIVLFTASDTTIDRQGFTIGYSDGKGGYYRKDNDPDKSPIFGGFDLQKDYYGAKQLMIQLGMVDTEGFIDFDDRALKDVIVKVVIDHTTYTKQVDGVTKEFTKNIITHFLPVDLAEASDVTDTSGWVSEELVLREPAEDAETNEEADQGEVVTLWFANELARDHFLETWFAEVDDDADYDDEPEV